MTLPPGTTVRAATDDDSGAVVDLVRACFSEYEGCVLDTDTEEPQLLRVASYYAEIGGSAWVVVHDGDVVASVACRPAGPGAVELKLLYVAARARRRGLGRALVAMVEQEARQQGASEVELWSDTRFLDAHRLYEELGYEQLPETRELHDLSKTVEYHFHKRL
ncbi:MAG: GNAT family N-acetyltransferase [Acidimicrobiales bacterium]